MYNYLHVYGVRKLIISQSLPALFYRLTRFSFFVFYLTNYLTFIPFILRNPLQNANSECDQQYPGIGRHWCPCSSLQDPFG
jgi:hypothetical protein